MRTLRSPQTSKVRILALIAIAVLFVLFLSANGVASFYTDWLWFDNMELGGIWTTILGTQIFLASIFTLIFFAMLWGNLYLADRLKPETRPESPEEDLVERYHAAVGAQAGKVRFGVAALFGLIAGANTSSQWQTWLLFRNGGDFGRADALFGEDAGFYVFRLPFWTFLVDWFFAALVLTLIVVLVAHYLNGGIRASVAAERVTSGVKLHISILLALLALLRAAAYWLDRFHLVTSTRGNYTGAMATDVNIQLPALNLLALISLFSAAVFVANIRRPGWGLPAVAIGIWLVSHFVIGGIFPLVYQRLRVDPEISRREAEFVESNIAATRFAYGLDEDRVTPLDFSAYEPSLSNDDLDRYQDVLANVPVVDPRLATEEVTRTEAARKIYEFSQSLDVDRYEVDGQQRPVVLSVRGLNVDEVGDTWEQQHVIFTHGHGLAMAAAYDETARVSGESRNLDFLVSGLGESDIDTGLELALDQPRIYFGEDLDGYAIVGAARSEVDFQTSDNQSVDYRYTGDGGVPMGALLRRTAFALRFRELDPLISRNVTDDSRVIYNRDIQDRVREIAPFLRFDRNPYPVVADGSLFWVVDAYTTTGDYPYSQVVSTSAIGDLSGGYNYVRNSVKVVVDAYNGDVSMYVIDESDPLIVAWRSVFPELFSDESEIPAEIQDNLRYPEDVFTVQTDMWTNYVVDDATQFIEGGLAWSVASQPRIEAQASEGDAGAGLAGPMPPQYLMAQLPDNSDTEFVLQRAFVPRSGSAGTSTDRPELTGIMMARSDPGNYGELVMVELPAGQVNAPSLVHSEIRKNLEVTEFIRDKAGARVQFGEMSIVLVDDTIVFVRPVYVEANSATAVPELQRVVAVNGPRIFMGESLEEAIAGVVDGAAVSQSSSGDEASSSDGSSGADSDYDPTGRSLIQLLADAEESLANAAEAAANDAPESAAAFRADAQAALDAAQELLQGPPVTTPPPTTSTTAPPAADEEAPADEQAESDEESAAGG